MNREKRFRRFGYFVLYVSIAYFSRCASAPAIKPPLFDYQDLVRRYFITNPGGHLPLTVEEGANLFPCTWSHYLFYTTTKNGSRDIWMRDLDNTVNVPLIQHASDQYAPTLDASGKRIVFVSEDSDTAGDLYIANLDPAPAQIVENTLQGISPPNFWVASRNLSTDIEALARTMPSACRGGASEKDPVWSPDGKHLYYTSDRCSPGKENIWMVEIGENRILRPPVEITHNGGVQPSLSPDGNALVYVSFSDDSRHARIHTMDLKTGTDHPVETDTEEDRIDLRPGYSQDGQNIYYYSIRRDSNGDGHIDFNDAAGIYERSLAHPDRERQLLEDGAPLFGLIVSSFAGGSLLYAAEQNGSINIYLMRKEGIIPIRDDIEEQYELTKKYVSESIGRYLLSLETLQDLFQSNPAYPVYEARSIADENSRYTRNGTAPPTGRKRFARKRKRIHLRISCCVFARAD